MAERPQVTVRVKIAGGADGVAQIDALAEAQENLADATADAAAAAGKQADATGKAEGRFKKLWEGLKAGAGAAASASAGLAGVAATLATDLDEGTKLAVAGLQGLSGVLGAFGPVGQLAATGLSLATAALATFSNGTDLATESGEGFVEKALRPMIEGLKTTEEAANEAASAFTRVGMAALGDLGLFSPSQLARRSAAIDEFNLKVKELAEVERAAVEIERQRIALQDRGESVVLSERQLETLRRRVELTDQLAEDEYRLNKERERAEAARAAYGATPEAGGGGTAAPRQDFDETSAQLAREALARKWQARQAELAAEAAAKDAEFQAAVRASQEAALADSLQRQRDEYAAHWQSMSEMDRAASEASEAVYADLGERLNAFGAAAADGFATAAANALLFGGSLKDLVNEQLQALTLQATVEAIKATALGLGYLAAGLFGFGPGLAAAKASFASAAVWGAIAGGAALGTAATGGFGGGGASGAPPGGPGALEPPSAFARDRQAEQPRESSIAVNLVSGQSGRPLSRQDGAAIVGALADLARGSSVRLMGA